MDVGSNRNGQLAAFSAATFHVHHEAHGDGWVWGAGLGRVTVRFETRWTSPGPVHTFRADDPALDAGHSGTFQS